MAIKRLTCQIVRAWDGRTIAAVDEQGAEFVFEPDGESQPRAVIWAKGDLVSFEKLSLKSEFSWRGSRSGKHDSGMFRIAQ